jgi:hypothetical protein
VRKFLKELAPRAGVQLINYLKELDLQTALTAHIEGIGAFGALTNRPCERYCGLTLAPAYLSLKLTPADQDPYCGGLSAMPAVGDFFPSGHVTLKLSSPEGDLEAPRKGRRRAWWTGQRTGLPNSGRTRTCSF